MDWRSGGSGWDREEPGDPAGSRQWGAPGRRPSPGQRGAPREWGPPGRGAGRGAGLGGQRGVPGRRAGLRGRVVRWVAAGLVVVVTAGLLAAYWKFREVWNSIHRVSVPASVLGKRPPQYNNAINLLVFASGTTAGLTNYQRRAWHVGFDKGDALAETLMIVHISPGHHRVTVVNIPRETVVPVYSCASGPHWSGQQAQPGQVELIGDALAYGGPPCLWKTVEQQTGIRIDHFIELGYLALVRAIDDIGGVNVCLPFSVDDSMSGLKLAKGEHHINGVTFLKFWRTRENIGTGSDLQRIQRDDYLLARALDQALHHGLFSSPATMYHLITDVAPQMTTDSGLTQSDLLKIGESLRGLAPGSVQFVQVPTNPYPPNTNWVEWSQPADSRIFRAIAHDRAPPKSATRHGGSRSGSHPVVLAASPSQVSVTVLNGSGVAGQAGQVASALASRGFHITGTGDAASFSYTSSVIEYSSASQRSQVKALRETIPHVVEQRVAGLPAGTLQLIIGSSFTGLKASQGAAGSSAGSSSSGSSVASLSKTYGGITGSASCSSDTGAFQGPLSP
jgi:LCP family protein required for cell wall assembly